MYYAKNNLLTRDDFGDHGHALMTGVRRFVAPGLVYVATVT